MNLQKNNFNRQRIVGLDIFRVLAALCVFLFHSQMHIGCSYGILNNFVCMGAIFMTGFYLLSGYALYVTYNAIPILQLPELKSFYIKRLIGVFPIYYFVAVLWVIFMGKESVGENIILAPIELFGIQSVFSSIFSVSHNGGTWFISCLIICYIIYPLIQEIIRQINKKTKIILIIASAFILLWSTFVVYKFSTANIYSNPFFRVLEFFIGVLLASMKEDIEKRKNLNFLFHWRTCLIELIVLISSVTLAVMLNIGVGDYMLYNWIALPIFILMIVSLSGVKSKKLENSKILHYLSGISYTFFLAQFFTWRITRWILEVIHAHNNMAKIFVSFFVCMVISIVLHEIIEKPFSKILRRKLL